MELILLILYSALALWLIISPLVYIYWYFNRDARLYYEKHAHAVFLGTLITLTIIIAVGLTRLIVFLPESWGTLSQEGVFVRMRGSIEFTLALLIAIHILQSMSKKQVVEDEKRARYRGLGMNRPLGELDYLNYLKPSKEEDEINGLQSMAGSPVRLHKLRTTLMFS